MYRFFARNWDLAGLDTTPHFRWVESPLRHFQRAFDDAPAASPDLFGRSSVFDRFESFSRQDVTIETASAQRPGLFAAAGAHRVDAVAREWLGSDDFVLTGADVASPAQAGPVDVAPIVLPQAPGAPLDGLDDIVSTASVIHDGGMRPVVERSWAMQPWDGADHRMSMAAFIQDDIFG